MIFENDTYAKFCILFLSLDCCSCLLNSVIRTLNPWLKSREILDDDHHEGTAEARKGL